MVRNDADDADVDASAGCFLTLLLRVLRNGQYNAFRHVDEERGHALFRNAPEQRQTPRLEDARPPRRISPRHAQQQNLYDPLRPLLFQFVLSVFCF